MALAIVDRCPESGSVTLGADDLVPLVARARAGDRRALEDLLRASYDHVYPVCRRILGNEPDAADASQDALMSVVRGLPRFDGRSRFSTWLYRIAMNASIDELRRRSRRPAVASAFVAGVEDRVEPSPAADHTVGMLDVETALAGLPVDFRTVVVLRDVCGLDYAEIADVLAIPAGTVRSRIARGRGLLAARLGGTGTRPPGTDREASS